MDNQRLIIWGFFAVMAYLTWQTWMQDYGPQPAQPPAVSEGPVLPADDLDALPELSAADGDLPSMGAAPAETPAEDKLVLYHFDGCPYCSMVRSAIDQLGIDIELRDIFQDSHHRDDLVGARGRATVPVLRIVSPDGEDRWMPESRDIVSFLQKTYG